MEKQWKASYLTNTCLSTYGLGLSLELRDPDPLREFSLNLSKKNRAVPAVCLIIAVLVDSMNGHVSPPKRKGTQQQICIGGLTDFTLLRSLIDRATLL